MTRDGKWFAIIYMPAGGIDFLTNEDESVFLWETLDEAVEYCEEHYASRIGYEVFQLGGGEE